MTKKILITGFEPFDHAALNPSGEWVKWMENQTVSQDRNVTGLVLPVVFEEAFLKLEEVCTKLQPDYIFLTGLAQNRETLTVERIGINWIDARIPDNAGKKPVTQKIYEQGPDGLFSTIDIDEIKKHVTRANVEIKTSTSAGEYVCNDLLYKALVYTQHSSCKVTFIHIPGVDNYDGIFLALLALINGI